MSLCLRGLLACTASLDDFCFKALLAWQSQLRTAAGQRKLQEAGLVQQLMTGLKQCATAPQLPDELLCVQQALEGCLLEQGSTPLGAYAVSQSRLVLHACARRCVGQFDLPTPAQVHSLAMQGRQLLCNVQAGPLLQGASSGRMPYHAAGQRHCPHHSRSGTATKILELLLQALMPMTTHVCIAVLASAPLNLGLCCCRAARVGGCWAAAAPCGQAEEAADC